LQWCTIWASQKCTNHANTLNTNKNILHHYRQLSYFKTGSFLSNKQCCPVTYLPALLSFWITIKPTECVSFHYKSNSTEESVLTFIVCSSFTS
jgi:hypothetical protein